MYTTGEVESALAEMRTDDQRASYALQVADFFRVRSNLKLLKPLLLHDDSSVVGLASWVAGEVIDVRCGRELFPVLSSLLFHEDPSIRFESIKPVAALIQLADQDVLVRLLMLVADEDPGVRRRALRVACLLSDELIQSIESHDVWEHARLLLPGVENRELMESLESPILLRRRLAVGGTARNSYDDEEILKEARALFDDEVAEVFDTLPKGKCYS